MFIDDVPLGRAIDKTNMMDRVLALPEHVRDTAERMAEVNLPKEYSECKYILVVGMGGSGIPGDFLRTIYRRECSIPIVVRKDYGLPPFVRADTLVFAVSYSGTTEETIDAFGEAMRRGAKVFGICSGDKLLELLREQRVPHFAPPAGRTTRGSFGYLLFPMVAVLERLGYIGQQAPNIRNTIEVLQRLSSVYSPESPTSANEAKAIAMGLQDRIPVVYGSAELTDVVALRWKQQLNENSKLFAQAETFPDVTHNQLAAVGDSSELQAQLRPIFLRNSKERPELSRRIDATRKVLNDRGIDVIEHWAQGESLMASLVSQSYLGDFVSLYLALLKGVDPTPTMGMSELKEILGLTDLTPG